MCKNIDKFEPFLEETLPKTNNKKTKQYLCKYVYKQKLCTSDFRNFIKMHMKVYFLIVLKFRDCEPKV